MTSKRSKESSGERAPRARSARGPAGATPPTCTDPATAAASLPRWLRFPIVGVAASAGGIEAFSQILAALPADAGIAIVFVLHRPAQRDSLLADLPGSRAYLPVVQITDGMPIEPDHVYVTPANAQIDFEDGLLRLLPRSSDAAQHTPADHFFASLAQAAQSRAIGVVLSGTAADGAMGLRKIKAVGGITLAQDPGTAKFDGMPRAAVATGAVDLVLAPRDLALELARISHHLFLRPPSPLGADEIPVIEDQLPRVFTMLRQVSGVDFSHYKLPTIKRRLQRRMVLHRITSIEAYVEHLQSSPDEVQALYRDLLIQVTRFFREPGSFKALFDLAFPAILANRRGSDDPVRVWVPGCATGEEPYSVAIALQEALAESAAGVPRQIFATDISEGAIGHARAGIYPQSITADVSAERLRRFFVRVDDNYRIGQAVRDLCVFARHDLTRDPPFSRLDLIVCRNVLIYLSIVLQKRLMSVFHYALKPNGYLMLGTAETVGPADLFTLVEKRHRLYTRRSAAVRADTSFAPPSPRTLEEPRGCLPALRAATAQSGANRIIPQRCSAAPVKRDLQRAKPARRGSTRVSQLQQELAASRERLQSIIQDLEAANEELQSANEEILSSNEELQSTNEQLDAAREELQSTNEELNTVNEELHDRNEELSRSNSDLLNLLGSVQVAIVQIAIVMVTSDLRIRRYTPMAEKVLNLLPGDVGRRIGDIKPNIECPDLESLICESIGGVVTVEREVCDRQGNLFALRIRPYKSMENRIDGAVLAVFDVDAGHSTDRLAEYGERVGAAMMEGTSEALVLLDRNLRVQRVNTAFERRYAAEGVGRWLGQPLGQIDACRWNLSELARLLREAFAAQLPIENLILPAPKGQDGARPVRISARLLPGPGTRPIAMVLSMEEEQAAQGSS